METQELNVEATEQGADSAMQECGETAIGAASADTKNVTAALATEQTPLTPVPQVSPLPSLAEVWQLTLGWQPNEQQQAQFQQLYTLILAGNHQFNLTRITEPTEFWEKHLWDSLLGVKRFLSGEGEQESEVRSQKSEVRGQELAGVGLQHEHLAVENQELAVIPNPELRTSNSSLKVIDIGTGAGFPGIPVAIVQPTWTVTLLDSTRKKMTFLDQVLASMKLANATTLAERVEHVGRQKYQRQTYDLALVRAVATATVCAEYALPLLNSGGSAVLYRGQWTAVEMTALAAAAAQLGGAIDAVEASTTPLTHSVRHCIVLKKVAPTPTAFPRAVGIPTQNPL